MRIFKTQSFIITTISLFIGGCALVTLPDESWVAPYPSDSNKVISKGENPRLTFQGDVEQATVEPLITIQNPSGMVDGRIAWNGRTATFVPDSPFLPGVRYVFEFNGDFRDRQGRNRSARIAVPFFYGSSAAPLTVVSSIPSTGSTLAPHKALFVDFSRPIDPNSLVGKITVSPSTSYTTSVDGVRLTIQPDDPWADRNVYAIRLQEDIQTTDGFTLGQEVTLQFLVQSDTLPPTLVAVSAALNDFATRYPVLGTSLDTFLGPVDAVRIDFSEEMDRDSVESAVRIVPDNIDSPRWIDDTVIAFPPRERWEHGVEYVLYFEDDVSDSSGNVMVPVEPIRFTPATPAPLDVHVEFTRDISLGSLPLGAFSEDQPVSINVNPPAAEEYTFQLTFSGGSFESDSEKESIISEINVSSVFPSTIGSPVMTGVSWSTDSVITITFSGFKSSTPAQSNYYALEIGTSGESVIATNGARMPQAGRQLLRTKQ